MPDILLSGDHAKIKAWRKRMGLLRTYDKRPDLFDEFPLTAEEEKLLREEGRDI